MARYYRSDIQQNHRISTEITGYAASTFVCLYELTGDARYLDGALDCARFLTRIAWDKTHRAMPFECDARGKLEPLIYFFDSGIIVRGLLSIWRATRDREFLDMARVCGRSMFDDFASQDSQFHPLVRLTDKQPVEPEARWSHWPGCYQLKAGLAWQEVFEETGEFEFQVFYDRLLEYSLRTYGSFLPGDSDGCCVMDRLHAFCYFLEGLLPYLGEKRCAAAFCEGLHRVAQLLREIAPAFERSDVYAQLVRLRLFGEWAGVTPVDRLAATQEARRLGEFQLEHSDVRIHGGFCFGRKGIGMLPFVSPVSTAFALQALALWRQYQAGGPRRDWRLLI